MRLLPFAFLLLASVALKSQTFTVSNPSSIARKNAIVAIPWEMVLRQSPALDTANCKMVMSDGKELPIQFETRGTPKIQHLLVQLDVPGNGKVSLQLQKGKRMVVAPKTYGRYVPERKDDFAWENDKVAFRMYGKELEKTPKEMAYGTDVWVKSTNRLVIDERYRRGRYHENLGDGMDYYHVGFTLGAGNVAPIWKDSICYDGTYRSWKILDNGPLRTTFQLTYDEWQVGPMKLTAVKTISLDAGSHFNRVQVDYQGVTADSLPLLVGIIRRPGQGAMWLDEQSGLMAYWEPTHGNDGTTGVGVLLTSPVSRITMNEQQFLAKTAISPNQPLVYYNGSCWDKAGLITKSDLWFEQLYQLKASIDQPLVIK